MRLKISYGIMHIRYSFIMNWKSLRYRLSYFLSKIFKKGIHKKFSILLSFQQQVRWFVFRLSFRVKKFMSYRKSPLLTIVETFYLECFSWYIKATKSLILLFFRFPNVLLRNNLRFKGLSNHIICFSESHRNDSILCYFLSI